MSIKTLADMCKRNVVENFDTNGAVIDIYDLGDKACADIIEQLNKADKIDDSTVDRLQVNRIETLTFNGYKIRWSDKTCRWLADVVAAGLEELTIQCKDFDGTIVKTIVDKYEKKMPASTSCNSSSELEEDIQSSGVVPALHTLRIEENYATDLDNLPSMLSIFAGTMKNLTINIHKFDTSEQKAHRLLDVIGTLCLDKLCLYGFSLCEMRSLVVTPSLQHLQTLKLEGTRGLSDHHVLSFLEVAGKNIQHLCLRGPNNLTSATLQNIKLYCPNLVSLDLSINRSLTEAGLEQFFETASLTKVERLMLRGIDAVTDAVVAKIVAATVSGQLSYIDIFGCDKITKQSLQVLVNLPKLKYVNFYWSCRLPSRDVDDFMTRHNLKYWVQRLQ